MSRFRGFVAGCAGEVAHSNGTYDRVSAHYARQGRQLAPEEAGKTSADAIVVIETFEEAEPRTSFYLIDSQIQPHEYPLLGAIYRRTLTPEEVINIGEACYMAVLRGDVCTPLSQAAEGQL